MENLRRLQVERKFSRKLPKIYFLKLTHLDFFVSFFSLKECTSYRRSRMSVGSGKMHFLDDGTRNVDAAKGI